MSPVNDDQRPPANVPAAGAYAEPFVCRVVRRGADAGRAEWCVKHVTRSKQKTDKTKEGQENKQFFFWWRLIFFR